MSQQKLWDRYCNWYRYYPAVGFALDISRMRFDDAFMQKMSGAAEKAFGQMRALVKGEVANPDENRMVGHYWLRSPELSPTKEIKSEIENTKTKILKFAADVHSGKISAANGQPFQKVLLLGIGGSALGPQLVAEALWHKNQPMEILFGDNTDPDGFVRLVAQLGDSLGKTLIVVISKSGGTPETRNAMLEIAAACKKNGLNFEQQAVAITCEGSKLDNLAKEKQWLERFPMWDWVGGRTSLFSAVGLVPAALCGVDIQAFLTGAAAMDKITAEEKIDNNPAMLLALSWYFAGNGRGQKDMVVLPYKDRLLLFSKYLQQLVMESLGKEQDLSGKVVNQGIAVYGNKGSTDQHAYVQQLRDGLNNFFATFIEVLSDTVPGSGEISNLELEPGVTSGDYLSGFLQGTRRALYENERDSVTISVDRLDTNSLGAMIALYERAVGFYASLVNVNAYHQPGVEAGKKAASRVLEVQAAVLKQLSNSTSALNAEEIAEKAGMQEDVETVYKILEHLAANTSRKITRSGARHPKTSVFKLN